MRRLFGIFLMLACGGLANLFDAQAGTLNVSFSSISNGAVVNLTTEGTTDWVHWGLFSETSVDRKANVAPLISNFTPVEPPKTNSYVFVYQFGDNFNGYSWSDGTPHTIVTNTTTGVWAYAGARAEAVGSGFSFTVPASTNLQTLKVYVGAFAATGKFVTFLSDQTVPGYTNGGNATVNNSANGPSAVYTINFMADSPTQTLTVFYTLKTFAAGPNSDVPNVTLQSAALSAPGANNLPFIALTNPPDQSSFSSNYTITLNAIAGDTDGSITLIEFYDGTDKLGEAASEPYSIVWTNLQPGIHVLTARAIDDDAGVGVSAPVRVFINGSGGSLSGTRNNSPSAVDLTSEGTSDWAHWGSKTASSFDRKTSGGAQISNFTRIGPNAVRRYTDNFTAFSWSDGFPVGVTNGSTTGVYITGLTNGFEISALADTNMRTLKVYVGLYGAQANFSAFLSDFSGPAFTDNTLSNAFGNRYAVYTVNYAAASPGQRLIVRQTIGNVYDFTFGNVTLQAATLLRGPPPPSNVPPVVTITQPTNTAEFAAPAVFALEASASDNDTGIFEVAFFNGAAPLGVEAVSPYRITVTNLSAGNYTLSAVATDNLGAKATNSISISVTNTPVLPVTIVAPAVAGTNFQFSFSTQSGRSYLVQRVESLPATNWQTFTNILGNGGSVGVTDDIVSASQRFYRVLTQ